MRLPGPAPTARAQADPGRPAGALTVIGPLSRSAEWRSTLGSITLDDVGDIDATERRWSEAVLWLLRRPPTPCPARCEPPRGVLLYGPPGCGEALVRTLASTGRLSVHAVEGSELIDSGSGSSRKGGTRTVPPGPRSRLRWSFSTRSTRSRRDAVRLRLRRHRPGGRHAAHRVRRHRAAARRRGGRRDQPAGPDRSGAVAPRSAGEAGVRRTA